MIICPKCNKVLAYVSYFNAYVCDCGFEKSGRVICAEDGDLYDVYFTDKEGVQKSARYFASSEEHAKRLFRSEQERGETLRYVQKVEE